MNTNEVRQDQLNEGRLRGTLGTRPGYSRPERPAAAGRKPFVAKGHDAILKGVQDMGGMIEITTMGDGTVHYGKLVARDKFTITIEVSTGHRFTFYKHAIESFSPVASETVQ